MPNVFSAGPALGRRRRDGRRGGVGGRRRALGAVRRGGAGHRRTAGGAKTCSGAFGQRRLAAEHRQHGLHVVAVDAGHEHVGAVDRPARGLDLVRGDGARLDVLQHAGELQQLGRREPGVGDDVAAGGGADQAAGHARVEQALGQDAGQRAAQEVLLAGDAAEVRGRVLLPVPAPRRILVLVLAGADVGEGVVAVEREAPGLGHVRDRCSGRGPGTRTAPSRRRRR